jgi:hypothetical protein
MSRCWEINTLHIALPELAWYPWRKPQSLGEVREERKGSTSGTSEKWSNCLDWLREAWRTPSEPRIHTLSVYSIDLWDFTGKEKFKSIIIRYFEAISTEYVTPSTEFLHLYSDYVSARRKEMSWLYIVLYPTA